MNEIEFRLNDFEYHLNDFDYGLYDLNFRIRFHVHVQCFIVQLHLLLYNCFYCGCYL